MNPVWVNEESHNHSMKYGLNMLYKFAVCLHHGAINDNKSNVPKTLNSNWVIFQTFYKESMCFRMG